MPHRCCIPCCKGNYPNGPKVSIFGFPADQVLRGRWLNAIKRKNFTPSKNSKVCELHFQKHDIQREVRMFDERRKKEVSAPLSYPRLVPGAVPSQICNCSKYLTNTDKRAREEAVEQRHRRNLESMNEDVSENMEEPVDFDTFDEFKSKMVNLVVGNEWLVLKKDGCVDFILLHDMPHPVVTCSLRIAQDLSLVVYGGGKEVKMLFGNKLPSHVSYLHELNDIIDRCFRKFSGNNN